MAVPAAEAAEAVETVVSALSTVLTLANVKNLIGRDTHAPESTIGGTTTCIVCFTNPKTHLAAPCGQQCACGP